ncbi:CvfD/Ygs/GSP13 family RNA-binding post-transcriptional regulator [Weissella bombi]|uniref:General stress protein 13 n=1 Tax=Weissella bombi TaxID=1505725 RepID=A0A1C4AS31_9LACO|nr:CvfD/Ygs/GSP13 family RNA-binding post-transcriptional regulator [Weissella bombi]SCB97278.1 general stress protein 13 [Weissella bombi]
MVFHIGDVVEGMVTGVQPYGAFVQLDDHHQGLIHISECRSAFIREIGNELVVGQKVTVMILDIDIYSGKISLSRRTVLDGYDEPAIDKDKLNQDYKFTQHHYWTNQHLAIGFDTIAKSGPKMIDEALKRLHQ